jgi:hypothetical protein
LALFGAARLVFFDLMAVFARPVGAAFFFRPVVESFGAAFFFGAAFNFFTAFPAFDLATRFFDEAPDTRCVL